MEQMEQIEQTKQATETTERIMELTLPKSIEVNPSPQTAAVQDGPETTETSARNIRSGKGKHGKPQRIVVQDVAEESTSASLLPHGEIRDRGERLKLLTRDTLALILQADADGARDSMGLRLELAGVVGERIKIGHKRQDIAKDVASLFRDVVTRRKTSKVEVDGTEKSAGPVSTDPVNHASQYIGRYVQVGMALVGKYRKGQNPIGKNNKISLGGNGYSTVEDAAAAATSWTALADAVVSTYSRSKIVLNGKKAATSLYLRGSKQGSAVSVDVAVIDDADRLRDILRVEVAQAPIQGWAGGFVGLVSVMPEGLPTETASKVRAVAAEIAAHHAAEGFSKTPEYWTPERAEQYEDSDD